MAKIIQALTFNLATPIDATQTSIPVRNLKDSRGTPITSLAGTTVFATIEPRSNSNQEIISFTGITNNGNGIVTLTGVTRNLNPQEPYSTLGGLVPHGNNAECILSNNPPFYNDFLKVDSNVTITGDYRFPTPVDPNNAATKNYVDSVAFSGAADANVTTKGVVRLTYSSDVTLGTSTITIATPAVITKASHGLTLNDSVRFTTTGALPTGLNVGTTYYVIAAGLTTDDFQVSASIGGAAVNTSGGQSGTHTLTKTTPVAVSVLDPKLPTTDEKAAMGGAAGVPSALNKFLTEANFFTNVDQSQLTQNADVEFGEANATTKKNQVHQSFVANNKTIRGVRLYKRANIGTFTGTVTIALKSDNAGNPDATLASVTISNAVWNGIAVGEFEEMFTTEYTNLTIGATYWISISASTADNVNRPTLGGNSAGGYANGVLKYQNVTDGYVTLTGYDLYFATLNGVTGIIPTPLKQIFKNTDTWVKPVGAKFVEVFLIGGGGAGASNSSDNSSTFGQGGGGGGGGGYTRMMFEAATLGATETVTVGAGGVTGAQNAAGGNGGNTSFGTKAQANGGSGGGAAQSNGGQATGGAGGAGATEDGAVGGSSGSGASVQGNTGGSAKIGAGSGGGGGGYSGQNGGAGGGKILQTLVGGNAGTSGVPNGGAGNVFDVDEPIGGSGGGASYGQAGRAGGAGGLYGGGGGGAGSETGGSSSGGAGGQGIAVIITYF